MINININSILRVKEDCINQITTIINKQLKLIESAKAKDIAFDEFKVLFRNLEIEKETLTEMKDDCSLIISAYIDLI